MSSTMITVLIFLGGALAVILVFAFDELAAYLGLQPKTSWWQIGPLSRGDDPELKDDRPGRSDAAGPEEKDTPKGRNRVSTPGGPAYRPFFSRLLTAP